MNWDKFEKSKEAGCFAFTVMVAGLSFLCIDGVIFIVSSVCFIVSLFGVDTPLKSFSDISFGTWMNYFIGAWVVIGGVYTVIKYRKR